MSRALLPPWLANASEGGKNIVTSAAKIDPPIRQSAEAMSRQWAARIPRAAEIYARVLQHVAAPQRDFEARLRREKLASLKQFTYGASHELNNPLFNISSRAQVLLRDEQNPERRRKLSTIYSHAMRASEMIKEMALAAHPPQPAVERCRIAEVLRGVVAELSQQAREQHAVVELAADADSSFEIDADPTQIAVAVREICLNALAALQRASRPGKVTLSVHPIGRDAIEITVRDDGPGLDARTRRHLFDPFFSGYESGRGLGFGLTKCWQIIDAHGGRIDVESRTGEGTVFAIRLPASAPRPRAAD